MINDEKKANISAHFQEDSSYLLIVAFVVGIGAGLGAIGFHKLVQAMHYGFFDRIKSVFYPVLGDYSVILLPLLGGLIVGPMVYFLTRETQKEGVPEVILSVAKGDGILSPRLILDKAITSAITIGSGGSAGREGPIIQIGAAVGSTIGQLFRMTPSMLKTMVACGVAGAIAATFNAPIGGVLFAQEIILGEFTTNNFVMIVISAVTSVILSRAFLGNYPAFVVPSYELIWGGEMLFYLVLGILTGLFAVLYIKMLYKVGDIFRAIEPVPNYLKPAIGGLLVGIIGFFFPQIFGVGYDTVGEVLINNLSLSLMVSLLFLKLIATSITLGSGAPGGDFAPGIYMGAMLGGAFGLVVNLAFPAYSAPAGAYALVAMGGVLAGMYQAPVTAIIMLFEMTGDYLVVLPLMVVCVISSLVARKLYPNTIFTEKLARKGLDITKKQNVTLLSGVTVQEVMTSEVMKIDGGTSLGDAKKIILDNSFTGFPVIQGDRLIGIITYEDVLEGIQNGKNEVRVEDILEGALITVYPEDSIRKVMDKMAKGDVGRLPVVAANDSCKLVGIISRSDIINAYTVATNQKEG